MFELVNIISRVFHYVSPADIISGKIRYNNLNLPLLEEVYYAYERNSDENEMTRKLRHLKDEVLFEENCFENPSITEMDIFILIKQFVKNNLLEYNNEVLCRFEHFEACREIMIKVDSCVFSAAKYAFEDCIRGRKRSFFIWKNILRHNDKRLNKILENGISDNHFHLYASAPYFDYSWLSLMNLINQPKSIELLKHIDCNRRNVYISKNYQNNDETYAVLHLQAAFIRMYLFSELTGRRIQIGKYYASWKWILKYIFTYEMPDENAGEFERLYTGTADTSIKLFLKKKYPVFYWLVDSKLKELGLLLEGDQLHCLHSYEQLLNKTQELKRIPLEECCDHFCGNAETFFDLEWYRQTRMAVKTFLSNPGLLLRSRYNLQRIIDGFYDYHQPQNKDYAINGIGGWKEKNSHNLFMFGEHWLLYRMFHKIYSKEDEVGELYNYFFAYLVIKERFRRELVQNNDRVGFHNFSQYQKRKTWFTSQYKLSELTYSAINTVYEDQIIKSLEIRIKPGDTFMENLLFIRNMDSGINQMSASKHFSFYYVFHFAREKDNTAFSKCTYSPYCRHYNLRKKCQKQALALIELREKNPLYAKRILGIDVCAEEEGCRPEVFASVYRVLKNHSCCVSAYNQTELSQLRATYHVGEVFQDIVDGLRAIDEAILFLNLDCGDRMGHATVLGSNPTLWYSKRNFIISVKRQDYLDNVVWLYHKLIQYHAVGFDALLDYLQEQFKLEFSLLYGKLLNRSMIDRIIEEACIYDSNFGKESAEKVLYYDFDIHNYHYSWMLRGDDPELYIRGYYRGSGMSVSLWDKYNVNKSFPKDKRIRYILPACILNYFYHYNYEIKELGNTPKTVRIPEIMVKGVEFVQKKMQQELAMREIGLETNPSSNVMIGGFDSYDIHPIVSFYNRNLTNDVQKLEECPQLNVSVNTDDQAVFSTTLSNEFALLVSSLSKVKDEDGHYVYPKANIYAWVKDIMEMGNEQAFIKINMNREDLDEQENYRLDS